MTDCFGVVKDMGTRINQQIVIYQCRRKPTEKSVRAVCIDVPVGGAGAKEEQFHIFLLLSPFVERVCASRQNGKQTE